MPLQKKMVDHVRFADETRLMAIRMPKSLEKRLLKLQAELYRQKNGRRVTLTETIVTAIASGLDAFEEKKSAP